MKEFDYSKWDNKPREMWVWNNDKDKKSRKFVVFVRQPQNSCNALVINEDKEALWYAHCAEIEQTRRMTNYELAHWLWEGTQVGEFRECLDVGFNYSNFIYNDDDNTEVKEVIKIRVNGGEWKEPLVELAE